MSECRWAVLVGACDYERHPPLKYATLDAAKFADSLIQKLGFDRKRVLLLADSDDGQGQPTRRDLFDALGLLCEAHSPYFADQGVEPIAKDDLFLFYFTGHGLRTKEGKELLLPVEASKYSVAHTSIALEDIVSEIDRLPCDHKVLFIDACREEFDRDDGAKAVGGKGIGERAIVDRAGLVTFYSCDPKDRSYEIDELQHGSFTYCLLEAIKHPEVNTLHELETYLKSRVPQVNAGAGKTAQKPFVVPNPVDMLQIDLFRVAYNPSDQDRDRLKVWTNELDGAGKINDDLWVRLMEAWNNSDTPNFKRKKALFEDFYKEKISLETLENRWEWSEISVLPSTPDISIGSEPPIVATTSGNGPTRGTDAVRAD